MLRRFAVFLVAAGLFASFSPGAPAQDRSPDQVRNQAQDQVQEQVQDQNQSPDRDRSQFHSIDRRQNAPGAFDFYVLALSWSPSYCQSVRERRPDRPADPVQCGARPFSFVVHGLWPQYERGFPSYCQVPAPRLNRGIVATMLDLMPSPRLVFHQWDRHGTCSGLSPHAYFETVRKARAVVKIPEQYIAVGDTLTVTPAEVREAFLKANSGLGEGGVAVNCSSKYLSEVRVCLTKEFAFRDCPEITKRACRRDRLVMPPVRGGSASHAERGPISVASPNTSPDTSLDTSPSAR